MTEEPCPEVDPIDSGMLKGARCEVKGPHEIHRVSTPGGWSSWHIKEKKDE